MRIEKTLNQPPAERITNLTRGSSSLFKKGEHISCGIASTTAKVTLLRRSEDLSLKNIKATPM